MDGLNVFGVIHGHVEPIMQLLKELGYTSSDGV